jgi:hypothetical protein
MVAIRSDWSTRMSLADLLPTLQALPRAEKLQAIHYLTEQLLEEDKLLAHFRPGVSYPVYSPYDAYEAAAALRQLLEAEKTAP